MSIILAKSAGFCFGVKRAVDMTCDLLNKGQRVTLLGELIHNKQVTQELLARGASIVDNPAKCRPGDTLVIRAHGVTRETMCEIEQLGLSVCDATCPFVQKIHRIVAAHSMRDAPTLIFGDSNHPEVIGIRSWAKGMVFILHSYEELQCLLQKHQSWVEIPLLAVAQTTFLAQDWKKSIEILRKHCTNAKIYDTICCATELRQKEAGHLAVSCDAMVIIGDRLSSNTGKLLAVCRALCPSYLVEGSSDLFAHKQAFSRLSTIGCTAGASTPARTIQEVLNTMSELTNQPIAQEDLPQEEPVSEELQATQAAVEEAAVAEVFATTEDDEFSAALEASLQSMSTDQKVKGIVTAVNQSEIQVDIGRKQTGYVAASEYSNDPNADPTQEVALGDVLDLIILKTNDAEGTVQLSKKKFDSVAAWNKIVEAEESGEILEGKVIDAVKGGVLVLSGGMRVFVPGSHSGLPRNEPLDSLKGEAVRFRIIEVNKQRRRAVGSVRDVAREERRAAEQTFWESAEVGQVIQGTVRSIVSYGAFVDIGGLDGMVHISELSWSRVKDPSEVLSVGDVIEVYIKGLDPEKRKISLGYRKAEDNPWEILRAKYPEGSVVEATIVSFTSFGAFARVIPGVDGLIHISQIAQQRVEKPQDVLNIGEVVQAKLLAVDFEKRRVSLSIRALIEDNEPEFEPEPELEDLEDAVVFSSSTPDDDEPVAPAVIAEEETPAVDAE